MLVLLRPVAARVRLLDRPVGLIARAVGQARGQLADLVTSAVACASVKYLPRRAVNDPVLVIRRELKVTRPPVRWVLACIAEVGDELVGQRLRGKCLSLLICDRRVELLLRVVAGGVVGGQVVARPVVAQVVVDRVEVIQRLRAILRPILAVLVELLGQFTVGPEALGSCGLRDAGDLLLELDRIVAAYRHLRRRHRWVLLHAADSQVAVRVAVAGLQCVAVLVH